MAIGIRASGTTTGDVHGPAGTTTITKPAAAAAGDLAVVTISVAWGSLGPVSFNTPTGWTAIAVNVGGSGASSTQRTAVFYRLIQAGDTSWAFTFTNVNSSDCGYVWQTLTGVDQVTPIDATGTTATNTGSATISAPAVTVITDQAWHCIGTGCWNGGAATATGFTVLNNGSPATNEQASFLWNTTPKSTGSTGAVTVTQGAASGNVLSAIPFAIRPAAGGANPPLPSFIMQEIPWQCIYE